MKSRAQSKVPVYGYIILSDDTRERKLAAYVTLTQEGYPVLEIKTGGKTVWVDIPVLVHQLTHP